MKTIGLLGGMSWESTVSYYRIVNTVVKERLGVLYLPALVFTHGIPQKRQGTAVCAGGITQQENADLLDLKIIRLIKLHSHRKTCFRGMLFLIAFRFPFYQLQAVLLR